MAILTIEVARSHCRVESDYPSDQLTPYMDAAQALVVGHLNRSVYEDEAALGAAQSAVPGVLGDAYTAYQAALRDADAMENPAQKRGAVELATSVYRDARIRTRRAMNGIVVNGAIQAAALLILGNLFKNREADVVAYIASELPTGVRDLLRPYRAVQMP